MSAWSGWEKQVLGAGGWPDTPQTERFLSTWQTYEQSTCAFNPLNTTLALPGSTRCNSAGVQSYRNRGMGTQATVRTLTNGFYFAIVAALASGNPFSVADPETVAAQIRTWGTGNFATWFLQQVAGTTGGPTLPPGGNGGDVVGARTAQGHRGYADLRNSVARHLPGQLKRSAELGQATLRQLAGRRKVRG